MRRRVTDEEAALLAKALADVKPLKRRRKRSAPAKTTRLPSPPRANARAAAGGERVRESPSVENRSAAAAPSSKASGLAAPLPPYPPSAAPKGGVLMPKAAKPSAFASGDPRIEAKARRGRIDIERTLDLHGLRQEAARTRLIRFVDTAYRDDCLCVLVVTGKGAEIDALSRLADPAPRGIIRARFLEWVEEEPLRTRIARVGKAAPRHGGAGAFYVFLKRRKATRPPS